MVLVKGSPKLLSALHVYGPFIEASSLLITSEPDSVERTADDWSDEMTLFPVPINFKYKRSIICKYMKDLIEKYAY